MNGWKKAWGNDVRRWVQQKTPMGSTPGSVGGFLLPIELQLAIDEELKETCIFRSFARYQPMASNQCMVPMVDLSFAAQAGQSPMFGGFNLSWTAAGNTDLPEDEPTFQSAELVSRDAVALCYASNQLVQDGGEPLAAYLQWLFKEAIEWTIDYACFNGQGGFQPLGVVNSAAAVPVTRKGAGHVAIDDIAAMASHLIPACFKRAVWCTNPTTLSDIVKLTGYFVNGDGLQDGLGMCGVLNNRPLYVTEKLPAMGSQGDLVLFDPKCYVLGQRHLEVASATESQTAYYKNQTLFRLIWRGDGQPLARGTSTLADGTTTAGTIVVLK